MASNTGTTGPSLYDPERAKEVAAFNASLTQAGEKQRHGRGRDSRGRSTTSKGISTRVSPGRLSLAASGSRVSAGPPMLGKYAVGSPSTQTPVRGGPLATIRHPSHASPTSGSNPWAQASARLTISPPISTSSTVMTQTNGLQPAAVSTRQPIVTHWGPDPVGPQIPSHLKQTSASAAIAEMATLIGLCEST